MALTSDEEKVLRAIADGEVHKISAIRGPSRAADRNAAIGALVERGLAGVTGEKRGASVALSEAGRAEVQQLGPARSAPARAATSARAAPLDIDALASRIAEALAPRLARIEAQLAALATVERPAGALPAQASIRTAPVEPAVLKPAVLAAVRTLDLRERYGGVVPLPALRRELRTSGLAAADDAVNDALIALERDYAVDLLIAQSPLTVPDRSAGIERPGRGLVYYVTPRNS